MRIEEGERGRQRTHGAPKFLLGRCELQYVISAQNLQYLSHIFMLYSYKNIKLALSLQQM